MIDVRVRQDDRIDGPRIDRRRLPIPQPQIFQSLEQSAVHENPAAFRLQQEFRARHCFGRAQKSDAHELKGYVIRAPSTRAKIAWYHWPHVTDAKADIARIARALAAEAERQFGNERAEALRSEIELMAAQLATIRSNEVDIEDEP